MDKFYQNDKKFMVNRQTQKQVWDIDKVNTFFSPKIFSTISD